MKNKSIYLQETNGISGKKRNLKFYFNRLLEFQLAVVQIFPTLLVNINLPVVGC